MKTRRVPSSRLTAMKTRKTKRKPKAKSKRKAYLKAKRALDKDRSDKSYTHETVYAKASPYVWSLIDDSFNAIRDEKAFKDNLTYIGILSLALLTLIVITSQLYSLLFG